MADDPSSERDSIFAYYEAQAEDYEAFYAGSGQALPGLENEYPLDAAGVTGLLTDFGHGDVVDLACGTAFWLSTYGPNCRSVTLVDQSAAMLAHAARRARTCGLTDRATLVRGDLFDVPLPEAGYDAALLGFILSHLTDGDAARLFDRVHRLLRPHGALAVVDSAWSEARRRSGCEREGFVERRLSDRRSFIIRKKYLARE